MLDPIADKLLVASCLLMLAADDTISGWSLWAAIVILCREILVSGLREYLAELRVSVPVTPARQMEDDRPTRRHRVPAGRRRGRRGSVLGDRIPAPYVTMIGLTLLWISAMVTLYTGYDYFQAGVRHLIE